MFEISEKSKELAKSWGVTDELDLININCGLHSGFPDCCIMFFVMIYSKLSIKRSGYWDCHRYMNLHHWNYIPCPHCALTGNRVKVEKCNCRKIKREMEKMRRLEEEYGE